MSMIPTTPSTLQKSHEEHANLRSSLDIFVENITSLGRIDSGIFRMPLDGQHLYRTAVERSKSRLEPGNQSVFPLKKCPQKHLCGIRSGTKKTITQAPLGFMS